MNELLTGLSEVLVAWGLKVLGAALLFVVGRMVARWARRTVRHFLEGREMDPTLVPFVTAMVYYLVLVFVIIAALGLVGIQTASLIAVLGVAGLAVGLALQGTLANFASGVMILVFRPFQKGHFIEAAGVSGSVDSVGMFTTTLNTPDNVRIILPNSKVWGETIKNYAANASRRNDMVMGISYGDDISLAMNTIRKVLSAEDRVLADPEPIVAVGELADSSVNILVRPWCKREDYWALRWDLTRTLKEELEAAGCSIPFPQRDVHLFQARSAESAAERSAQPPGAGR